MKKCCKNCIYSEKIGISVSPYWLRCRKLVTSVRANANRCKCVYYNRTN